MLEVAVDSRRGFAMSMSSLGATKQLHATCNFVCLAQQHSRKAGPKKVPKFLPSIAVPMLSTWLATVSATRHETCGKRLIRTRSR